MATFRMEDGTIVKTENSSRSWEEETYHDGHNYCSKATGGQWTHETLYRSRKGRYYVVSTSQWQGSRDHAAWVSEREAARWLMKQDIDLPEDLEKFEEELSE